MIKVFLLVIIIPTEIVAVISAVVADAICNSILYPFLMQIPIDLMIIIIKGVTTPATTIAMTQTPKVHRSFRQSVVQ